MCFGMSYRAGNNDALPRDCHSPSAFLHPCAHHESVWCALDEVPPTCRQEEQSACWYIDPLERLGTRLFADGSWLVWMCCTLMHHSTSSLFHCLWPRDVERLCALEYEYQTVVLVKVRRCRCGVHPGDECRASGDMSNAILDPSLDSTPHAAQLQLSVLTQEIDDGILCARYVIEIMLNGHATTAPRLRQRDEPPLCQWRQAAEHGV